MKKLLSTLLIGILNFGLISNSFAIDEYDNNKVNYLQEISYYKNELNATKKGQEYSKAIDSFFDKIKSDEKKLVAISDKLSQIESLEGRNETISNTLLYLEARTNLALLILNEINTKDIFEININSEDKINVETKILELQKALAKKGEQKISAFVSDLKQNSNSKQTGDVKVDFEINEESFGKINANIELKDYKTNNYNFDSQISGTLNVLFDMAVDGEKINFELNTLIDAISKEGNLYFILKDLNLTDKNIDTEVKKYIEKLKELGVKNQYIKYEDAQTTNLINMMKSLDYSVVMNDINKLIEKPLFEAYKKEDSKYLLRPTKYACDSFKAIQGKFDPFNGGSCSESQYNSLLKGFAEFGKFYMSFDNKITTFGFEGFTDNFIDENKGYISFTNDSIIEYNYSLKPNQKNNPGEYFSISLKDEKILGGFSYASEDYDYINEAYTNKKYTGSISGNYNNNRVEKLDIIYKGTDDNKNQFMSGVFNMKDNDFSFGHINNTSVNKTNIKISGSLDGNKILNNLNLDIDIETKKGTYDYETWEYTYAKDFSRVFSANYTIQNKVINGEMIFYSEEGGKTAKVSSNGSYSTETFVLNNKIELSEDFSSKIFYDSKSHKITGNLDINFDSSNSKNNVYIGIFVFDNSKNIFKYTVDGKSKIELGAGKEITEPSNTVDFDEVFDFYYY